MSNNQINVADIGAIVDTTNNQNQYFGVISVEGLNNTTAGIIYNLTLNRYQFKATATSWSDIAGSSVSLYDATKVGVTIKAPSLVAVPYTITLPSVAPAAKSALIFNADGTSAFLPAVAAAANLSTDGLSRFVISNGVGSIAELSQLTNNQVFLGVSGGSPVAFDFVSDATGTSWSFASNQIKLQLVQGINPTDSPTFSTVHLSGLSTGVMHSDSSGGISSSEIVDIDVNANAGIKISKLESISAGMIIVGNSSNIPASVVMTGQASIDSSGSVTLDNDSVIAKTLSGFVAGAGTITGADSILSAIEKLAVGGGHVPVTLGTANGLDLSGQSLSLNLATSGDNGALSSADFNIFNAKQPAGNYITDLSGEVSASGPGIASATVSNSAVIAKTLTGYTAGAGTVTSSDSILSAIQKLGPSEGHVAATVDSTNGLGISGQQVTLQLASSGANGALSSADFNVFNNKQASGNYITDLSGDIVANGPGSVIATLPNIVSAGTNTKLTYNAKGQITSGTSAAMTDLSDTTISSTVTGQMLVWNGTKWVNQLSPVAADWVSGTSYPVSSVVVYQGAFLRCTTANSDAAIDLAKWQPLGFDGAKTGETTGFDPATPVNITYDPDTRIVTITPTGASFTVWVKGKPFVKTGAQATTLHAATTGTYYVEYDSTGTLQVGTTGFDFANRAQVFSCKYDTTQTPLGFGQIENHGMAMDWATHLRLHDNPGTVKISGGLLTTATYVVRAPGDTRNAGNSALVDIQPGVDETVIADEDLRLTLLTLLEDTGYTTIRKDHTNDKWIWTTAQTAPFYRSSNVPQYNPSSGGVNLVSMTNTAYICMYLVALPPGGDTNSQLFRFVWIPGQTQYVPSSNSTSNRTVSRDLALAEDPNLLDLTKLSAERVIIGKLVVGYDTSNTGNDYRLRIEGYQAITGSRTNVGVISGVAAGIHNNLSGRSEASAHPSDSIDYTPTTAANWATPPTTVLGALDTLASAGNVKVETANTIMSGPATGAAALPTFRSLISDDFAASPSLGKVLTSAASGAAATWTSPLVNPMDSSGDMIVGGAAGAATKLAVNATATPQYVRSLSGVTSLVQPSGAELTTNSVPYAQIQQVSATSRILGRITTGAGNIEELTGANVQTIIGDISASKITGKATAASAGYIGETVATTLDYANRNQIGSGQFSGPCSITLSSDGIWAITCWTNYLLAGATYATGVAAINTIVGFSGSGTATTFTDEVGGVNSLAQIDDKTAGIPPPYIRSLVLPSIVGVLSGSTFTIVDGSVSVALTLTNRVLYLKTYAGTFTGNVYQWGRIQAVRIG